MDMCHCGLHIHTCTHTRTHTNAVVCTWCVHACVYICVYACMVVCVCVPDQISDLCTLCVCYLNKVLHCAYPVWVEGQTFGLPYLLTHKPSMVLNGAQPMCAVDIVDLDGLVPRRTTEEEATHTHTSKQHNPPHIKATHTHTHQSNTTHNTSQS